jgi:HEAT repeat protein
MKLSLADRWIWIACLGTLTGIVGIVVHWYVPRLLVERFEHAQYFWEQFEVGQQIVARHDRRVLPALAPLLNAPDRYVRGNAAYVFAALGEPRGFDVIVGILNDYSWRPPGQGYVPGGLSSGRGPPPYNPASEIRADRYYAAHLLGDLKDPRAVPILIPMLADPDVQEIVPWSLGQIGDHRAVEALIHSLSDPHPDMRVLAIDGLQALQAKEALPALHRLLNDPEKSHFDEQIPVGAAAKAAIDQLESR